MINVLVVDTDRELVTSLERYLKVEGYAVRTAYDGEEALRLCTEHLPNVLIMEGLLPKIAGFELAKKVRDLPDGGLTSIILISAIFSAPKYKKQVQEAQIDDVLVKPFTALDIFQKIEKGQVRLKTKAATEEALATAEESSPLNLSGSMIETSFVRLVYQIYRDKLTGTLRLQNQTTKKLVTFENGEPKFVVSNLEQECLGQVLVKKGRLSPEECKQSLEQMAQLHKRQGETLIQMGLLEPFELEEALKLQAREKFCEIFAWRDGDYLFVTGKVFKKDLTAVDLSIPQLCLRGVKEHYSIAILQTELNRYLNAKPYLNTNSIFTFDDFKFATWDMRISQQIRRGKSIGEVLQMGIARDIDVYQLYLALYMLDVMGFQEVREIGDSKKVLGAPKPPPSQSPFEFLGISITATNEEIEKAYKEKATKPIGEDHAEYLLTLKKAFEQIASIQGRKDYLVRLYEEQGALPTGGEGYFKPEEILEIGKRFMKKKDSERAKKVFQDGVTFYPEEGLFYTYLGYTLFTIHMNEPKQDTKEKERSVKMMIKGTQLSPDLEETHFLLGRAFALDKDYVKAAKEFQRVLEIKPKHKEAGSELRVAQMRMEKQKNSSFIKWK